MIGQTDVEAFVADLAAQLHASEAENARLAAEVDHLRKALRKRNAQVSELRESRKKHRENSQRYRRKMKEAERAVVPNVLSGPQLADACMSYRHDFGLMRGEERNRVLSEAADWWRCFEKTINDPPAHLRGLSAIQKEGEA